MTRIHEDARHSRQSQVIDPKLHSAGVVMAGLGMLGSFTAIALARCAAHVVAFDPDTVEDVNSGNQAYHGGHIGQAKTAALADLVQGLPFTGNVGRFPVDKTPSELLSIAELPSPYPLVVISAADSMATRADMAKYAQQHAADVFIDMRAMGELAVVCIVPPSGIAQYLDELPDDASVPDIACGMQGGAYTGMWVAGRVVSYLNAYFRGLPNVPWIHVEDLGQDDVYRHEVPGREEAPREVIEVVA